MATLHRVTGPAGTEFYSGQHFDEKQAKEAYTKEHGEVPIFEVHTACFDVFTAQELRHFMYRGND